MIFLTTFTEWLEANAMPIVAAFVSWLITAAAGLWYISQIAASTRANGEKLEKLAIAFDNHADDFDKHKTDASVHTTFEFRQSVTAKFDRLEDEVKNGHDRIEGKIDRLTERILAR